MALSIGFRDSVFLFSAIRATRLLTFASVGLSPTGHSSLSWTHCRTAEFPRSGLKPWRFVREPSHSPRGSSAGAHTPRLRMVCSQLSSISCVRLRSALCPTTALKMEPPSAQSPFAGCRRYLHPGDVDRLLRGHYSPVMAPTDSFVNPARSPLLRPKPRSRSLGRLRPAPA